MGLLHPHQNDPSKVKIIAMNITEELLALVFYWISSEISICFLSSSFYFIKIKEFIYKYQFSIRILLSFFYLLTSLFLVAINFLETAACRDSYASTKSSREYLVDWSVYQGMHLIDALLGLKNFLVGQKIRSLVNDERHIIRFLFIIYH